MNLVETARSRKGTRQAMLCWPERLAVVANKHAAVFFPWMQHNYISSPVVVELLHLSTNSSVSTLLMVKSFFYPFIFIFVFFETFSSFLFSSCPSCFFVPPSSFVFFWLAILQLLSILLVRLEALDFHGADLGQGLDQKLSHLQVGDQRDVVVDGATTNLGGHSLLARVRILS